MSDTQQETRAAFEARLAREAEERRRQRDTARTELRQALAGAIQTFGITAIEVTFDGSGDEGATESIAYDADNRAGLEDERFPLPAGAGYPRGGATEEGVLFDDLIESYVDLVLSECGVNWHDNEGGFGTWTYDRERGFCLSVNQRFIDYGEAHGAQAGSLDDFLAGAGGAV